VLNWQIFLDCDWCRCRRLWNGFDLCGWDGVSAAGDSYFGVRDRSTLSGRSGAELLGVILGETLATHPTGTGGWLGALPIVGAQTGINRRLATHSGFKTMARGTNLVLGYLLLVEASGAETLRGNPVEMWLAISLSNPDWGGTVLVLASGCNCRHIDPNDADADDVMRYYILSELQSLIFITALETPRPKCSISTKCSIPTKYFCLHKKTL
jgi:hypothetical protein